MNPRTLGIFVLAACLFASWHPAFGQSRGYAINRFEPSARGSDWYVNESLDLRGDFRPAVGLVLDWAYRPVVLRGLGTAEPVNLIVDQIFAHVGGVVVFHDRVRAGIEVPVALFQNGEDGATLAARTPGKASFGDVRLSGDLRLVGEYGGNFGAAIGAEVHLPTGSRALFTSDGTVRVAPRFLVAGIVKGFPYAAKVGFSYRPWDGTFEGRPLGSEVFFSAAVGVKANDRFVFGPELFGSTVVTGGDRAFRVRNTPLELLLSAHVSLGDDVQVGAAIGPGFTRADGNPGMRVLFSFEYAPDICVDKDGDKICANEDACPDRDGVASTDPKRNGCPAAEDKDAQPEKKKSETERADQEADGDKPTPQNR